MDRPMMRHLAELASELKRPMFAEERTAARLAYHLGLSLALAGKTRCSKMTFICAGPPKRIEIHVQCGGSGYDLTTVPQFSRVERLLVTAYNREFNAKYQDVRESWH